MIEAAQIRAARALLGLSQTDLSKLASLSVATVKRLEAAPEIRGAAQTLWKIESTLEKLGVEFIPADELKGPGARLRRSGGDKPKKKRRGR
jgi:ribosome-binding protein aMBF1 (putative translation factor)